MMRPATLAFGLAMFTLGIVIGYTLAVRQLFVHTKGLANDLVESNRNSADMHLRVIAGQTYGYFHYPGPDNVFGAIDGLLISEDNPLGLVVTDPRGVDNFLSKELGVAYGIISHADGYIKRCYSCYWRFAW